MSAVTECFGCGRPVDRTIPDPVPEGYELWLTEAITGRAHYCQACFDAEESAS